ncbi:activating signal cointegrator 1 complex subunit [Bulinus truncatus]|nr:activating signal cointegrator 1 complex subunit [Bulinus truncatus]
MISFFYHLEDTDHSSINRYLSGLVGKSLMELEMSYCLEVGEDNRTITPLTLGRIASYYYLKHGTMRMFRDSLSQHCTIPELIDVLSNASEFAELPVRHNEDQLNGDLANQIPLEVNRSSLDSSHTKTNILLQAYFSRLTLPSSDFQTDTKSVLDQAIRVLQAMLDVSADEGWLVTSLNIIMLIQMVVQGRWWNDSTLLTLPHMQTYHVSCLRSMGGKRDNRNFSSVHGPIESLPQLMDICDGKHHVLNSLFDGIMEQQQIDQVCQVLVGLPQIEVKVEVKGWLAGVGQDRTKEVDITYSGGVRPESCWLPVHADQEYVFHITLRRINRSKPQKLATYEIRSQPNRTLSNFMKANQRVYLLSSCQKPVPAAEETVIPQPPGAGCSDSAHLSGGHGSTAARLAERGSEQYSETDFVHLGPPMHGHGTKGHY